VHLLDSTQPERAHPNKISSKKATIAPNKIFFGLYEQCQPAETVLGSTQLRETTFFCVTSRRFLAVLSMPIGQLTFPITFALIFPLSFPSIPVIHSLIDRCPMTHAMDMLPTCALQSQLGKQVAKGPFFAFWLASSSVFCDVSILKFRCSYG
jgi:hypothetical protein